jgi:uncharacterized membrane protein
MKRTLLIASAVAAVAAMPAFAAGDFQQIIDEKCYGVSAKDIAACGAQDCANQTSGRAAGVEPGSTNGKIKSDDEGQSYALVPKGTCTKMYNGSLTPKKSAS